MGNQTLHQLDCVLCTYNNYIKIEKEECVHVVLCHWGRITVRACRIAYRILMYTRTECMYMHVYIYETKAVLCVKIGKEFSIFAN